MHIIALAPPDPGAQSSVVEEDRGVSSHKHGLAGLVDDVVVHPAVIRDVMYGAIAYIRLRRLKCWFKQNSTAPVKDGEFTEASDSDLPYRGGDLTKTEKKLNKAIAEQS